MVACGLLWSGPWPKKGSWPEAPQSKELGHIGPQNKLRKGTSQKVCEYLRKDLSPKKNGWGHHTQMELCPHKTFPSATGHVYKGMYHSLSVQARPSRFVYVHAVMFTQHIMKSPSPATHIQGMRSYGPSLLGWSSYRNYLEMCLFSLVYSLINHFLCKYGFRGTWILWAVKHYYRLCFVVQTVPALTTTELFRLLSTFDVYTINTVGKMEKATHWSDLTTTRPDSLSGLRVSSALHLAHLGPFAVTKVKSQRTT
jgi:hypothetical protein